MKKIYRIIIVLLIMGCTFPASGCKSIFRQRQDKYAQKEVTKENLEEDTFYIKSGTRFVSVYKADTKTVTDKTINQSVSLCFLTKDYQTVPTLYKGEILAIASQDATLSDFKLTRYKEIGYSFGIYGVSMDKSGYLAFDLEKNGYKKSDSYNVLKETRSKEIRLSSINGEKVSEDMITSTGVLNCLMQYASYDLTFYSGTYYSTAKMIADTFILQEFEYFKLENASDTINGYLSFIMPEDAKSGWYYIAGHGLFKYVAAEKGVDEASIDYNAPYYAEDAIQEARYSQKFSTSLDIRMKNVMLQLYYDPKTIEHVEDITGTVYAPDNTMYQMELNEAEHYLSCSLQEAMAGKWMLYVDPKNLLITDMKVVSIKNAQTVTEESYQMEVAEDKANFRFQVSFSGDGEIYAIVIYPDGSSHELMLDSKNKTLYYTAPFISADSYEVKVYHYTDTNVDSVTVIENTLTDSDIITVTE